MTKAPDLSAFPIPRKGGARPIEIEEPPQQPSMQAIPSEGGPPVEAVSSSSATPPRATSTPVPKKSVERVQHEPEVPLPVQSGQMVATTVKLDESRYLRLSEAGRPGRGRLKRRTIQEMMIEALDEWFEKRGL